MSRQQPTRIESAARVAACWWPGDALGRLEGELSYQPSLIVWATTLPAAFTAGWLIASLGLGPAL
jgi:hypothetical protein